MSTEIKRKLSINTATGITDIIMAIICFFAPIIIVGSAFDESLTEYGTTGTEGQTTSIIVFLVILSIISLILHIVALLKSKKVSISTTGHILGIVGAVIFMIIPAISGIPAMVLYILAAVYTLKQKNINK